MKTCTKCGLAKPFEEFYRCAGMKDGYRSDCRACNLEAKHQRYVDNPGPAIARAKRWQQENAERVNAKQRARRAMPEAKRRARAEHLMRKFGMTIEQYDAMLEAQGGGCFICGRPPREDISLHIDHDHSTGMVRGLLCFRCNNAIADFNEDPTVLRKAIRYLSVHAPGAQEEIQLARWRALSLVGRGS